MSETTFTLNGAEIAVSCEPDQHLLEVLREKCGMISVKDGCSPQGYCGCCTVLIDGRPALACLRKADQIEGRHVVTLDGVAKEKLRILSESFVQEGGIQCGFCIPGIVMRAYSFLERTENPDRTAIERALSGHLCRCTGYTRIVDAIQTAGENWNNGNYTRGEPRRSNFFGEDFGLKRAVLPNGAPGGQGVGRSSARYRGIDHAVGHKKYVADMQVDGMLHGAVVLSEHPRAKVLSIDPEPAIAMPGVTRVLTAEDVRGQRHVGLILK
ncbi:MAG: 2Fe-2S iron-sulfur cluster binding domain-containing protein, partial [Rhodothermales bacterium]|nr:2Fe-2S iron-sulfur cluster binding domain-containing protein [Rhodothermales bacterium]